MESEDGGPAMADEERDFADPSTVIYLVEDIKPDISNLSCEGVVHDCLVKREDHEELLYSKTQYYDVKTGTSEVDVTMKLENTDIEQRNESYDCLLYTSPSPRDKRQSRMPSSA